MKGEDKLVDEVADRFLSEAVDFASGKRTEYPELLAEPLFIDPKRRPPEQDKRSKVRKLATKAQREYQEAVDREISGRWNMLFLLYGIDRTQHSQADQWRLLCGELAARHVPAFRVVTERSARPKPNAPKKRDAPKKQTEWKDAFFVHAVEVARREILLEKNTATIAAAVRRAHRMGYLTPTGYKFGKRDNAIPRYNEALRRWKESSKLFLDPGSKHTPQTLAWRYLKAVQEAGEETYKN